jgi:hypothetical protein
MQELVDLQAVERWFVTLALIAPILGLAFGALLQYRRSRPGALLTGLLIGLLGPANWLLWHIYNRIEDHYGLDSVKAMLFNLALFAALGLIVGMTIRIWNRRQSSVRDPRRLSGNE